MKKTNILILAILMIMVLSFSACKRKNKAAENNQTEQNLDGSSGIPASDTEHSSSGAQQESDTNTTQ